MSPSWFAPTTLALALAYLQANPGVVPVAGGTDLLVKHFERLDVLPGFIGLNRINGLAAITTGSRVHLGALVTHHQVAAHPWLREHVAVLTQAAEQVGAPQIRHRGTIGGNIANASPAADTVPPLVVLGAEVELAAAGNSRKLPLEQFFNGPGRTVLAPGELVSGVEFPAPAANQGGCYIKIGRRKAQAIATASIAVQATVAGERLEDVAICAGSVAPTPLRAKETEAVLKGSSLASLPLARAKEALQAEISPIDDIRGSAEYRRETAGAILERALLTAIYRAGGGTDG